MNVAEAKRVARSLVGWGETFHQAAEVLADEVDRLEAQLESARRELAATAARLAEWDHMLAAVYPVLEREMP